MKTRKGFVSNSSSSSFILMIPAESFDEWQKGLSKIEQELLDEVGYKHEREILGRKCIEISRALGHDEGIFDYTSICLESEDEDDDDIYGIWDEMMNKLPKDGTYIYI